MFVITVERMDGFVSEAADQATAEAEVRWAGLIDTACRTAEERHLTVVLSMFEVDAPNETAAIAARRAGMGRKVKRVRVLPPKNLARKVTQGGEGAVTEAVLDAGQKVVDEQAKSYPAQARADLLDLQALVDQMTGDGHIAPDVADQMHRLVYKMKAQGGTFGYPLVTAVAHHLYVMSRALKLADQRMIDAIQVHIDTMHLILNRHMTGMSDDGRKVVDRLHEVVVKMVGKPEA